MHERICNHVHYVITFLSDRCPSRDVRTKLIYRGRLSSLIDNALLINWVWPARLVYDVSKNTLGKIFVYGIRLHVVSF